MNRTLNVAATLTFLVLSMAITVRGASELTFNANAKPATLVLNGVNRMGSSSSDGFYLRFFDGKGTTDIFLNHAITVGDTVTVSATSGSLPRFTFRVDEYDKHVSIHLINIEGIGDDRRYGLRLKLQGNTTLGLKTLSDMVDRVNNSSSPTLYRKSLWGAEADGTLGGVAIYDGSRSGATLDASLAEIWVTEPIPRPAGQTNWNDAAVLAWVADYASKLNGMNDVLLEATSPAELYDLTDRLAISNNVRRVYLHTKTWRGEYWPNYHSRVHVNTDVFPAGKTDLLAYSNCLKRNNVL